jgi:hypothetical protein
LPTFTKIWYIYKHSVARLYVGCKIK